MRYEPMDPSKYPGMAAEVHSGRMRPFFEKALRDLDPGFREYLDANPPQPDPAAPAGAMPTPEAPEADVA